MFSFLDLFNWKRLLIEIAIIAVLVGVGYWYFNYSQNKISILEANLAKMTVAVDEQKKAIVALQAFNAKQAKDITQLQGGLSAAEAESAALAAKLAKHNIEELARAKPKLMEKRFNSGSNKAIQELMDITGAKK